jgi:hypothetical protein
VVPQAATQEVSSLREALAQDPSVGLEPNILQSGEATYFDSQPTITSVSIKQSYIWVSIILAVVLFFSVMSLLMMDSGAEKDTILYAKFLRVENGR